MSISFLTSKRIAFVVAAFFAASLHLSATAHASGRTPELGEIGEPGAAKVSVSIDKTTQSMTVSLDGAQTYHWPVSTGMHGHTTPSGSFVATSMNEIWYSKEWDNAPMPHAVFFMRDGHAIHATYDVKHLGKPASHGCVRLAPQNATILFDLVKKAGLSNVSVTIDGSSPGGEDLNARIEPNDIRARPWRVPNPEGQPQVQRVARQPNPEAAPGARRGARQAQRQAPEQPNIFRIFGF